MSTRSVGQAAEQRAARFLEEQGYKVLVRNYTTRAGEIDLICEDTSTGIICFVEVRSRRRTRYGLPEETIKMDKKRKVIVTARQFLASRSLEERECRFDVVTLIGDEPPVLTKDAFGHDFVF